MWCLFMAMIVILEFSKISGSYVYETKYLTVPVDHFDKNNKNNFDMKYLVNDTHWDSENGPIFLYTGNQGPIEMFADNTGLMWDIAEEFKAKLVFAEHRYYGESLPFGDKSVTNTNLGYLTTEQAIADYADLINFLDNLDPPKYPVVAFGGSYGGMLATYIRLKYPHLVEGAIASSAPVNLFPGMAPCEDFYKIVTMNFKRAGRNCDEYIKKSWAVLRNFLSHWQNYDQLSHNWGLCDTISNPEEVEAVLTYVKGVYETLATSNYPYETDYSRPLPEEPVNYVCQFLNEDSRESRLVIQEIGQVLKTFTNYTGKANCIDYKAGISGGSHATGAWGYQRCTEIVLPTCTTGNEDMFEPSPWNMEAFAGKCQERYQKAPQPDKGSIMFGEDQLKKATNIVFSNGLLDPWAAGGILNDINGSIKAVVIEDAAHHLDLMASHPSDSAQVKAARQIIKQNIHQWISQFIEKRTQ